MCRERHAIEKQNSHENEPLRQLRSQLRAESSDGLKLMADLENNPICSVSFDASISCVVVTWKRYATSTQLRFVHENILTICKSIGRAKSSATTPRLPTIHAEDQTWIIETWMPRAIGAGLKAVASKHSDSHFGRVSVSNIRSEAPAGIGYPFV